MVTQLKISEPKEYTDGILKKTYTPEHVTNLACLELGDSPPTFLHHVEKMCYVGFFDHEHAERRFYGLGLLKVRWKVKVLWVSKSK